MIYLHKKYYVKSIVIMSLIITSILFGVFLLIEPQLQGRQPIINQEKNEPLVGSQYTATTLTSTQIIHLNNFMMHVTGNMISNMEGKIINYYSWGNFVLLNGIGFELIFVDNRLFSMLQSSDIKIEDDDMIYYYSNQDQLLNNLSINIALHGMNISSVVSAKITRGDLTADGEKILNILGYQNILFYNLNNFQKLLSISVSNQLTFEYANILLFDNTAKNEVLWTYYGEKAWIEYIDTVIQYTKKNAINGELDPKLNLIKDDTVAQKNIYYFVRIVFALIGVVMATTINIFSSNERIDKTKEVDRLLNSYGVSKSMIRFSHTLDYLIISIPSLISASIVFYFLTNMLGYNLFDVANMRALVIYPYFWILLALIPLEFLIALILHYISVSKLNQSESGDQTSDPNYQHLLITFLTLSGIILVSSASNNPGNIILGFFVFSLSLIMLLPIIGDKLGLPSLVIKIVAKKKWNRLFVYSIRKMYFRNYRKIFTLVFSITFISLTVIGSLLSFQHTSSYTSAFDNGGEISFSQNGYVNESILDELSNDKRIGSVSFTSKLKHDEDFAGLIPKRYTIIGIDTSEKSLDQFSIYEKSISTSLNSIKNVVDQGNFVISKDLSDLTGVRIGDNYSIKYSDNNNTIQSFTSSVSDVIDIFPGIGNYNIDPLGLYPDTDSSFIIMSYNRSLELHSTLGISIVTWYNIEVSDNEDIDKLSEELNVRYKIKVSVNQQGENFIRYWMLSPIQIFIVNLVLITLLIILVNNSRLNRFISQVTILMYEHNLAKDHHEIVKKIYRTEFMMLFFIGLVLNIFINGAFSNFIFIIDEEAIMQQIPLYISILGMALVLFTIIHQQFNFLSSKQIEIVEKGGRVY